MAGVDITPIIVTMIDFSLFFAFQLWFSLVLNSTGQNLTSEPSLFKY
jgi:hypothetical protein